MMADGLGDSPAGEDDAGKGSKLVQRLELSFVQVWIVLGQSGVGDAYYDALKAFIAAAVDAYERGYTLAALLLEIRVSSAFAARAEKLGLTPEQIQGIELSDGDKQVREYWLRLVYLTLAQLRHSPDTAPVGKMEDPVGMKPLVQFVVEQKRRNFTLEGMKLEMQMAESGSTKFVDDDRPSDAKQSVEQSDKERNLIRARAAVRSQWMRIVYMTAQYIEEQKAGSSTL